VGIHESRPSACEEEANSEVGRIASWHPTSREKRARCGAPEVRWQLEFLIEAFHSLERRLPESTDFSILLHFFEESQPETALPWFTASVTMP
jgi:hypothetical protein